MLFGDESWCFEMVMMMMMMMIILIRPFGQDWLQATSIFCLVLFWHWPSTQSKSYLYPFQLSSSYTALVISIVPRHQLIRHPSSPNSGVYLPYLPIQRNCWAPSNLRSSCNKIEGLAPWCRQQHRASRRVCAGDNSRSPSR